MNITVGVIIMLVVMGLILFIPKMNLKLPCTIILSLALCLTGVLAFARPPLHKPLSLSVIEYLIKINTDGSVTTTKQTTTTELGKTK